MKDCEFCSGSGCVYCKQEFFGVPPAPNPNIEKILDEDMPVMFHIREIKAMKFSDINCCKAMVDHLNKKCSSKQYCPMARMLCDTDCPSFLKAEFVDTKEYHNALTCKIKHNERYVVIGFKCDSPMLVRK